MSKKLEQQPKTITLALVLFFAIDNLCYYDYYTNSSLTANFG
ncbi:MAG: hypothetical protein V7K26_34405 [Nostoc sp.]